MDQMQANKHMTELANTTLDDKQHALQDKHSIAKQNLKLQPQHNLTPD